MKHLLLAALFVLPFVFVACSDDDDNGNGNGGIQGHFTYDGQTFNLDHGFMVNYGQAWSDGYNFDVWLHSDGIQVGDHLMDMTGKGHGMFFEMYSADEDGLAPGTYAFDDDDEGDPYTFYWADIIMDYDIETEEGLEVDIAGGTVKVERSGSTYTFHVDAVGEDGKKITGYFRGSLLVYDIEDIWKSTEKLRPF